MNSTSSNPPAERGVDPTWREATARPCPTCDARADEPCTDDDVEVAPHAERYLLHFVAVVGDATALSWGVACGAGDDAVTTGDPDLATCPVCVALIVGGAQ